jgi:hypothetical protein
MAIYRQAVKSTIREQIIKYTTDIQDQEMTLKKQK